MRADILEMGEGVAFSMAGVATIWLMGSPAAWIGVPSELTVLADCMDSEDSQATTESGAGDSPLVEGGAGMATFEESDVAPILIDEEEAAVVRGSLEVIVMGTDVSNAFDGTFETAVVEVLDGLAVIEGTVITVALETPPVEAAIVEALDGQTASVETAMIPVVVLEDSLEFLTV